MSEWGDLSGIRQTPHRTCPANAGMIWRTHFIVGVPGFVRHTPDTISNDMVNLVVGVGRFATSSDVAPYRMIWRTHFIVGVPGFVRHTPDTISNDMVNLVVGVGRFELPISCSQSRRVKPLRYTPYYLLFQKILKFALINNLNFQLLRFFKLTT